MKLRDYQQKAVSAIKWAENMEGNDLIVLPTGAGKSLVIAEIANQKDTPVLIFQPSKEILEQNMGKLSEIVGEAVVGVYSASLARKEVKKYTFATIGSVKSHPEQFAHFKLVIIDECHLVNPKSLDSMFVRFLRAIGNPKVVGLTATPYRLCQQYIRNEFGGVYTITTMKLINRIKERFWTRLLLNINVGDLVNQGHLCPLNYRSIKLISQEFIALNKTKSDFDMDKYGDQILSKEGQIIEIIKKLKEVKKSTLVFCPSAEESRRWSLKVEGSEYISAQTKKKDRKRIIEDFKGGKTKVVFNVGVLTTGFDHPSLDCIVLLRPTRSVSLYYQMLGRGLRKAEGKVSCLVVDMTDTVNKIGRVETIKLDKKEGKWELLTEKGSWHGKELYRFEVSNQI